MDSQIRNFKDFLQLYNKLTEMCFSNCVDNFFNRNLSNEESVCVDKCVSKFTSVNQKIMSIYVEAQSAINERRMAELETLQQQQQQQSESANGNNINNNNNINNLILEENKKVLSETQEIVL